MQLQRKFWELVHAGSETLMKTLQQPVVREVAVRLEAEGFQHTYGDPIPSDEMDCVSAFINESSGEMAVIKHNVPGGALIHRGPVDTQLSLDRMNFILVRDYNVKMAVQAVSQAPESSPPPLSGPR
jgi:hypothetical protein